MFSSATKSAAQGGGYNLTKSLRFRSSASAYLNRTLTTPTNNKIFTISFWFKIGSFYPWTNTGACFLNAKNTNSIGGYIQGYQNNAYDLGIGEYNTSSWTWSVSTSAAYRDPSAWYHAVFAVDTTQATASNRVKIYVNGVLQTALASAVYPSQNSSTYFNSALTNYIGSANGTSQYFDGEMTEYNFIDGQQLTASSFGSTNATTGVWQPARYTGTYGTNGFYLPFTNTTSTTTLGYDSSGNSNNWTTNNISLTAGSTYDSMTDVPTLTSATAANYCVLNPLDYNVSNVPTIADGNLKYTTNSAIGARSTIAMSSGKWYCEVRPTSTGNMLGIISFTASLTGVSYPGSTATGYGYYSDNGNKYNNGSNSAYGATYGNGDVIGIAFDADAGTLTYYKNNTSQGTAFTGLTSGPYSFVFGNGTSTGSFNFGQQPFAYSVPSGYKALNTYNLPDSTIVKGNKYMDATTYAGAGGTSTITNAASFKPDLVWVKSRTDGGSHVLQDSVRGVGSATKLSSNSTNAENNGLADATDPIYGYLTAINSNGFSAYAGTVPSQVNKSGQNYVAWQWQANQGTNVTNTNGSITSTVSVNATAGFSVVTMTTPASGSATYGHGLGIAPSLIIIKPRAVTSDWPVYHTSIGAANILLLNTTAASSASSMWNSTAPTSSVFSTGGAISGSLSCVAYCWAAIPGFSAFGSYTGNGSADGPFIYTGFRPKFVMWKKSNAAEAWVILDTSRDPSNLAYEKLYPMSSGASDNGTGYGVLDIVSNGFKIRSNHTVQNANGDTYIYAAFAENPFKNALAR